MKNSVKTTYPVMDTFRLVAGGRYNYDKRDIRYRIYSTTMPDDDGNFEITYDSGIKSAGSNSSKPTFKVGAEYDLAEQNMLYFQASSGFKSGGITMLTSVSEDYQLNAIDAAKFDPETSLAYELGSKNRFMENRLQVNGAVYITVCNGMQVQMPQFVYYTDSDGNEREQFVMHVANGGKTNMLGGEVETTWLATAVDRFTLSLATLHGKYKEIVFTDVATGSTEMTEDDVSGYDMANTPHLTVNFGYTRTQDLGVYGTLSGTFDLSYKSDYYNQVQVYYDAALTEAHHIEDIYLNWTSPKGMFSASASVKNILNKAYILMGRGDGEDARVTLNNPRTYNVALTLRY